MVDDIIKARVKVVRQFYPKNKNMESGDWGILTTEIVENIEGQPCIDPKWNTITIKGIFPEWCYGEEYMLIAKEEEKGKYQYPSYEVITFFKQMDLSSQDNQKKFLKRILTDKQVEEVLKTIENPIEILENHDVETLCKVKGIGISVANKIIDKYEENKDYSAAYVKLDKLGLTNNMIKKLCDTYGNPNILVQKIESDPYIIADEVNGIGWSKADDIAIKSGIAKKDVKRIKAYIKYRLHKEANENGHVWIWVENLVDDIEGLFYEDGVEFDDIMVALGQLMTEKKIWSDDKRERIALGRYYWTEKNIARDVVRLVRGSNLESPSNWMDTIKEVEKRQGWNYGEEQLKGIETSLKNNFILITGFGGCGKSSIVNGMLKVLSKYESAQCALSGKASVNLTQITGQEGYTIHRLLGYNPSTGWNFNKDNKMFYDIIILDELSMVDEELFYRLIQSVLNDKKVIMLGDVGQLQNLGVGNLIRDFIDSGVVTHVNLTEIHRQAKKSGIITNSIKIWNGEDIIEKGFVGHELRGELQDFEIDITKGHKDFMNKIMDYFKELYKKCNTIDDIMVILPMKKDVQEANIKIQSYVRDLEGNSINDPHITTKLYDIYVGDKVMNIQNNYKTMDDLGEEKRPIMNGNMGIVKEIDVENETMIIDFEKIGRVFIPKDWIEKIELAYAGTVHKLQGSSINYIVCALNNSHYKMRTKELLYTMITRARKHCTLIAENNAIRYAVKHSGSKMRNTFLADFIKQEYAKQQNNK